MLVATQEAMFNNVTIISLGGKKVSKKRPSSLRELQAVEKEVFDEFKEAWIKDLRWISDCYWTGDMAYINIVDIISKNVTARFEIKKEKLPISRLIPIIQKDYRIKINIEEFYERKTSKEISLIESDSERTEEKREEKTDFTYFSSQSVLI